MVVDPRHNKTPRLRRDRIFSDATSSLSLWIPPKKMRCVPHIHTTPQNPTQNKAMRFHPDSPFGKAWAAHYKAANLARLSDEEKRVEYNRFCTEWEEKMGRGPAH